MTSKNNTENVRRCRQKNYDQVVVTLPKGEREPIKAHALVHDGNTNAFIIRAIRETMERDNAKE